MCKLKGKIWIDTDKGSFLGYGRLLLLQKIKETGSISESARALNMSYKKAWKLVESINSQAPSPLVITRIGGKKGGGARLTPLGEKLLDKFQQVYRDFQKFLDKETEEICQIIKKAGG